MAKRRPEEPKKGPAPWMATFSDLMNLLLCFFVLLFSMSTVDAEKFQMVIASLQSKISIFPNGGASIGDGDMVGAGVRQLEYLDIYYTELANSKSDEDESGSSDLKEQYSEAGLKESEEIAEEVQGAIDGLGIKDQVEVDFDEQYVMLNLSGAILFDSGKAEIINDAIPVIEKISKILQRYDKNIIEIEGHTDNVPLAKGSKYEDNDVLSMYRALSIANYIRANTDLNDAYIKSSGRGEHVPVADNTTPEGRARNRRVVIKIYNSYSSNINE